MQSLLRFLAISIMLSFLAACSTGPKPVPEPAPEPDPGPEVAPKFVQPQSVPAKHHWLQRPYLLSLMQEAEQELTRMSALDDGTLPVLLLESQAHQLLMAGGDDIAEYQHKVASFNKLNPSQPVPWVEGELLAQFSAMLDWSTVAVAGQMDLDYLALQGGLKSYLVGQLQAFPFVYELAISIAHDSNNQHSLLIIEGATEQTHMAELQALVLASIHLIETQSIAALQGYDQRLLRPALKANNGPLVRFILQPVADE